MTHPAAPPASVTPLAGDASSTPAMDAIDHIVVLMMENRSFDHLLGALSLPAEQNGAGRTDVDGLRGPDRDINYYDGQEYPIFPLASTVFHDEPCHDSACVGRQLEQDNGGFVWDFAGVRKQQAIGDIMGYIPAGTLGNYERLIESFALCDHWHCSVLGPTWPNRLYSIAGESDGQHDNNMPHVGFSLKTIFEHLDDHGVSNVDYSHSPLSAFLRVFRRFLADTERIRSIDQFYASAQAGTLPGVSWLEPDYGQLPGSSSNDDHPPTDLVAGQALVARVYNALRRGPNWAKTLLIITYDEHGGFYDHITPPAAPDRRLDFRQYGLRVPSFVISPWIPAGVVAKTIFDHTSILKTILLKFCRNESGAMPDMGTRVQHAADLWPILSLDQPRDDAPMLAEVDTSGVTQPVPGPSVRGQSLPTSSRDALFLAVAGQARAAGVPESW